MRADKRRVRRLGRPAAGPAPLWGWTAWKASGAAGDIPADFPKDLLAGYHLTFFPDWLDFYREDRKRLLYKFGSMDAVAWYYGGGRRKRLWTCTGRTSGGRRTGRRLCGVPCHRCIRGGELHLPLLHTNEEIIDAAAELINLLLGDAEWPFAFLVENQWWPGFTLTEPENTSCLLEGIRYPRKGILLDTGHLMNAERSIATQRDGVRFILEMLDRHGPLCRYIQGMHLHQSISGAYVRRTAARCR